MKVSKLVGGRAVSADTCETVGRKGFGALKIQSRAPR